MTRLMKPTTVNDLIDVANHLVKHANDANLEGFLRRSVSSAYYAVFHTLCFVAADQLVGWKSVWAERVYRSIDHGTAKSRLVGQYGADLGIDAARIGVLFAQLQEMRHRADYDPNILPWGHAEVRSLIEQALEIIHLINKLDDEARQGLAVLLVVKPRP